MSRLEMVLLDVARGATQLTRSWHLALSVSSAVIVRAAWAARPDVPLDLLELAAADRYSKVRCAAAGNELLDFASALRAGGSSSPYGPLVVATRSDCPDDVGARLVSGLGTLRGHAASWVRLLSERAPLMAGKPLTQGAALAGCHRLSATVPGELIEVLCPEAQDELLRRVVGEGRQSHIGSVCLLLPGSPTQVALVAGWLQLWWQREGVPGLEGTGLGERFAQELQVWCDPLSVSEAELADVPHSLLSEMVRHATDPVRLANISAALVAKPRLIDAFAANPAVPSRLLLELVYRLPLSELRERLVSWLPGGSCPRPVLIPLVELRLGALVEAANVPATDVLAAASGEALSRREELVEALDAVVNTPALAVLGELLGQGYAVPLGRLVLTAAEVVGLVLPSQLLGRLRLLPTWVAEPARSTGWDPDDPPF